MKTLKELHEATHYRPDALVMGKNLTLGDKKDAEVRKDAEQQAARLHNYVLDNHSLKSVDKDAIADYSRGSSVLNRHLSGTWHGIDTMDAGSIRRYDDFHKRMFTALGKIGPLPETVHTYSGICSNRASEYAKLEPGDIAHSQAYTSTSLNAGTATSFGTMEHYAHFIIPAGEHHGGYVAPWSHHPGEMEYTIKAGSSWKYLGSHSFLRYNRPRVLHSFAPAGSSIIRPEGDTIGGLLGKSV